jgi:hypothetical protein
MKKNTFLIVSLVWTLFLIFFYPNTLKFVFCGVDPDAFCREWFRLFKTLFLIGPALFISSLAVFLASEEVFRKWKKFTIFSILAYIAIVVLMPWSVGDEIAGFTKGMAGLVLSALYLVISLVYVFFLSRKNK